MIKSHHSSLVAGARPNFKKVAPVYHALAAGKEAARAAGIDLRVSIVHTGQHYDENMSDVSSFNSSPISFSRRNRFRDVWECFVPTYRQTEIPASLAASRQTFDSCPGRYGEPVLLVKIHASG